ncbi:anti-lipopolysaccharide factor [Portunus trituberculatus]|uniref:Anti-lipopolysaccharide factor n=2 Tax=Portunus trituberculatus TaxID=210409 RepID=ALPS_PORTR|nr:anti-lipopolysaccharide factor [Portunus trituberculatus]XP_045132021.1 anti-lipopolysaccharide factor [Portunus trituberculatus]XP_045132022.1 anti-lipopolysaccharide factor [Portunus trituberculatus]C0KJQ4.2 RecName: Full=Anti-lipopolysaccharide factor; Short=PtALF; Flags: Precursor [Portunus trituberculatus]ACM89169.2 anti-lipopolysaccharide factor [Portunus trituberculatus]ACS45385.2 anti-lipopolysaccharide factor isoform 3 [Portunus trituberculatus]
MRKGVVAGLCLALVVMCLYLPQPCEAQYEALVTSILGKLTGLWHNDSVDFMGHICYFRRRPKIRRFKLYHEGKFWCPGWAPFEGRSRTKSRSGSSREATKDFVRKALQNGLVTQQDASLWLNN